jgi:hypothetical protein
MLKEKLTKTMRAAVITNLQFRRLMKPEMRRVRSIFPILAKWRALNLPSVNVF